MPDINILVVDDENEIADLVEPILYLTVILFIRLRARRKVSV